MRKLRLISLVALVTGLLAACAARQVPPPSSPSHSVTPSPVPTPTPVAEGTIVVDVNTTLQTIYDIGGGNFIHKFSGRDEVLDPVGRLNMNVLNPHVARVRMGLEDWEIVNDNADPDEARWELFADDGFNHRTFLLMQSLAEKDITIIASIWDVPDWLVANPQNARNRFIPAGQYPELVESISTWLLHARDTYGVDVDYISFNEPTLGVQVALSSGEYIEIIKRSAARFAALGLRTQWLLGDCEGVKVCQMYVTYLRQDTEILPHVGPMAVHSWDVLQLSDSDIHKVGAYVADQGLDLWITEAGWDPFLYQRREEFPTWKNALSLAAVYNRLLRLSRASVFCYWEMLGDDYSTNDGAAPYPVLNVLRELARAFPPGTRIVETALNTPRLYAVAGQAPDHFVVHMVTTAKEPRQVQLLGLPQGSYAHIVSTADGSATTGVVEVQGLPLSLELPPESVHTLTLDTR